MKAAGQKFKTSDIKLKPARSEDKDFLRHLHHQAYRDVVVRQFGAWDEKDQDRRFEESLAGKQYQLIQTDRGTVGAINLENMEDCLFLAEIQLLPDWQGQGIGSSLMKSILGEADKPVKLRVLKENKAKSFYKKLGFYETGQTDTHILMEYKK